MKGHKAAVGQKDSNIKLLKIHERKKEKSKKQLEQNTKEYILDRKGMVTYYLSKLYKSYTLPSSFKYSLKSTFNFCNNPVPGSYTIACIRGSA